MTKHTPGPWLIEPDAEGEEGFFSIWCDFNGSGAELAGRIGEEANARLIAAAPDMLAALDEISRKYSNGASADTLAWIARAATAKAEGRS